MSDPFRKTETQRANDKHKVKVWACTPYPKYQFYIYTRTKQWGKYHYVQLRDSEGIAMLFDSEREAQHMIKNRELNPDHCRIIPARKRYLRELL